MALWGRRQRLAIGFGPDRLRLLVARGNGTLEVLHSGSAELPAEALRGGLQVPAFGDREAVAAALEACVQEARAAGHLRRRPELVALVVSDGTVKMAATPLEGPEPARAEGDQMARWALRDLLPIEPEQTRAVWSVLSGGGDEQGGSKWLFSLGAQEALVREYEALVAEVGLNVGRLIPWTMAASAGADAGSDLVLCDGDGTLASMFAADGVPRFHRAWRARVPAERLGHELPALQRFVADRLEMSLGRVWLCGADDWTTTAAAVASSLGLEAATVSPEQALMGALRE